MQEKKSKSYFAYEKKAAQKELVKFIYYFWISFGLSLTHKAKGRNI